MLGKAIVIVVHAAVGWALCGATMGLGLAYGTETVALWVHGVAAPVFFAAVSWVYFRYFAYTPPAATAVLFLAVILVLDVVVVSLLIRHTFDMFESVPGTWLPLALIFAATWLTGSRMAPRPAPRSAAGAA